MNNPSNVENEQTKSDLINKTISELSECESNPSALRPSGSTYNTTIMLLTEYRNSLNEVTETSQPAEEPEEEQRDWRSEYDMRYDLSVVGEPSYGGPALAITVLAAVIVWAVHYLTK